MNKIQDLSEQGLFIDILADMIFQYLNAEQERQQRAAFWLDYLIGLGIEARIVA